MNIYKFILMIVVFVGIVQLKADDEAKALLYEAKDITSKASFKAVTPVYINGKLQKTINLYRMLAPDGTLLEKVENIWLDSLTETYIKNKSGTYILLNDSLMKADVSLGDGRNPIYLSITESYNDGASYSVSDGKYKDTPCYKVTVKLPTDKSHIDKLTTKFRQSSHDPKKYITTLFPFVKDYLVGKDNHFIYACSFYNLEGEKTLSRDWGNVDFKAHIDESMFKTPEGNVVLLDKKSEKLRYIRNVFAVINPDLNDADDLYGRASTETNASSKTAITESDKARDILFSAMNATEKASFKATCKVTKGGKGYQTINEYHKAMPDGTVKERVEYIWWNSWKETFIPSATGTYAILDKTLVKTDLTIGSRRYLYRNIKCDVIEDASYSLADGNYKGIPCYKITVKIPTDAAYVKDRIKRVQRNNSKTEEELMKILPFAKTVLVGKKNNFIYSSTFYDILGKRTSMEEWGTVTFNPTMDDSLFEPPKGVSALTAQNPKKFMQIKDRCAALFNAAKR